MGKIRIKTLGSEEQEKLDKKKAEARAIAKKAKEEAAAKSSASEETESVKPADTSTNSAQEKKSKKKEKFLKIKKQSHSVPYTAAASKIDKTKKYNLAEALTILPSIKLTKFDETVELHINTVDKGISGAVTLPHGTGKAVRVEILNSSTDSKHVDEVVKKIEAGQIDFDILIATPDAMPRLAKVARILGPRGMMPNPKNNTVTTKPEEIAKKFEGGQMNFKTEAKFPLLHLSVGKISFGEQKLAENIKAAVAAVSVKKIKTVTLKSTMSPGMKLDIASL